jgi:HD-GYP domain-containing protein (c-di-GMP phosphodiesterase class II)
VLEDGVAAYTDIYTNQHGTWITGFAPIRDANGKTVAALDVDFRADVYLGALDAVRRRMYLHSAVAAALALGAGLLLARRITRPLAQLTALARSVVEGHLSERVRISARDEIGMLGNVLYLMVDRIGVSHKSVVDVLVRALEARDASPGALSRMARASLAMGEDLALSQAQREALELGTLLHDIGEIRTPEAILQKPAPLSDAEWELVRQHPTLGGDILESVPLLTPALDVVVGHHERYDGTGYPNRLAAESIPLTARIFAVVDALDAMTHERPHRSGRSVPEALDELRREAGKQFDPRVVEAALKVSPDRWAEILDVRNAPALTTVA